MLRRFWFAFVCGVLPIAITACEGHYNFNPTAGPSPSSGPTATASASSTPNAAAFVCPSSDAIASNSIAGAWEVLNALPRRAAARHRSTGAYGVSRSALRRWPSGVSRPYFPNDPYFNGFSVTTAPAPGATKPPATFQVGPYEEGADVPGQWGMHAIKLESAFAYSQPNNGSTITNVNALGSNTIKIAIIDTGEDPTHPELQSKIVHQTCFITNPGGTQSTSAFAPDPTGHGTDVSGIAAAAVGNSLGYVGAGGNAVIYAYRVLPTPDDNCVDPTTADPQCGAAPADVASAVDDAVKQGVNVISISLGADGCSAGGVDKDAAEDRAVTAALKQNIIVVAATGNTHSSSLEAPSCHTDVIAVGASALDDGQPNGTRAAVGSASSPVEYVAGYSNYGAPSAALRSAAAWGIVAPGGDPVSNTDADNLHWIDNIWTSTPFKETPGDQTFAGLCADDYPNASNTTPPLDCRTLIAGTSMATPLVAGAAALILSVNATYQSPVKMKQLLCTTADDIHDNFEGCGRLNVYRAMATALNDPSLP